MAIKYISPSALRIWEKPKIGREQFYLFYLATHRLPRSEQIQAAGVGSGFDARVKSAICQALFGNDCPDTLRFDALFESQVGESHRDWALAASQHAFDSYVKSGRYTELLFTLQNTAEPPKLEGRLFTHITGSDGVTQVPILGLPDLTFKTRNLLTVIHDWKVKGFCSSSAKSPTKLYVMCRDGFEPDVAKGIKPSRGVGKPHRLVDLITVDEMTIHDGWMEDADRFYADQLAMYLWAIGEPTIGSNHVVSIDELVCKPQKAVETDESDETISCSLTNYPLIRIATIAARISDSYQATLLQRLTDMWKTIQSGHIFTDRSRTESDIKCAELNAVAATQSGSGDALDAEFGEYLRSKFRFAG